MSTQLIPVAITLVVALFTAYTMIAFTHSKAAARIGVDPVFHKTKAHKLLPPRWRVELVETDWDKWERLLRGEEAQFEPVAEKELVPQARLITRFRTQIKEAAIAKEARITDRYNTETNTRKRLMILTLAAIGTMMVFFTLIPVVVNSDGQSLAEQALAAVAPTAVPTGTPSGSQASGIVQAGSLPGMYNRVLANGGAISCDGENLLSKDEVVDGVNKSRVCAGDLPQMRVVSERVNGQEAVVTVTYGRW